VDARSNAKQEWIVATVAGGTAILSLKLYQIQQAMLMIYAKNHVKERTELASTHAHTSATNAKRDTYPALQ